MFAIFPLSKFAIEVPARSLNRLDRARSSLFEAKLHCLCVCLCLYRIVTPMRVSNHFCVCQSSRII